MFSNRHYRNFVQTDHLNNYKVTVQETNLSVYSNLILIDEIKESILKCRNYIESYINQYPEFLSTLTPYNEPGPKHSIIEKMIRDSMAANTGPMASVAGTISEFVVKNIKKNHRSVTDLIIENGGDIYMYNSRPVTIAVFAGDSPLSMKFGIEFNKPEEYISFCTSSGKIGHSLSFGSADAVCVISKSGSLADAVATSLGNIIKNKNDIKDGIELGKRIIGVKGIVIIKHDKIGMWGDIKLVPLRLKA